MRPEAKLKPLAVCNVCQALTALHGDLNHRCRHTFQGRRCYGTYKSGLACLWDRCESCEGVGKTGSETCRECSGFGWKLYA